MGFGSSIKGLTGGRNPAALGRRVIRVGTFADIETASANEDAAADLFRVSHGEVMITQFWGIVTLLIAGAATIGPVHTPTSNATPTEMCVESATINAEPANTILTWDGDITSVLAPIAAAGIGVGLASFSQNFQILVPGVIGLQVQVVATAGAIDWILHYIPLDPNAVVNAI